MTKYEFLKLNGLLVCIKTYVGLLFMIWVEMVSFSWIILILKINIRNFYGIWKTFYSKNIAIKFYSGKSFE